MSKPYKGSIAFQLNELGIKVTKYNDKKYPENNVTKRMLIDKNGVELGYHSPGDIKSKFNIKVY